MTAAVPSTPRRATWGRLLLVALFALLTLVLLDRLVASHMPNPKLREVTDGLRDLQQSDPATLVIGSSHGRTFHVLGEEVARRTGADHPLVAIPVELGKMVPYQWLLENRVAPIIDARDANGAPLKKHLRRLVLLTEWWDSCNHDDGKHPNLPSRVWDFDAWRADVQAHGINAFNRNYVQKAVRDLFEGSRLVLDRSFPGIRENLLAYAKGLDKPPPRDEQQEAAFLASWHRMLDAGVDCIGAPEQMKAFAGIVEFARARQLEMIVVLFPRKPATVTPFAWENTFPKFKSLMTQVLEGTGIRLIDYSLSTPLTDADFMADFDHVNPTGNQRFAAFALDHDFAFLLQPESALEHHPVQRGVTLP